MKKSNKGYKIQNYGRIFDDSSRRRKKRARNTIIFIVVVLLLVFLGYSISGPLVNLLNGEKTQRPSDSSSNISSAQNVSSSITEQEKEPEIPSSQLSLAYLPLEIAKDNAKLIPYLENLKNLGYNSVVLELKDESGNVYYNSANELAISTQAINVAAISNISEIVNSIKAAGLTPVANINAFKDTIATKNNDAKIKYSKQEGWSWFDAANGKPWLNPYSETAQNYIIALASELADLGFSDIMVSSIMFPNVTSFVSADFGPLEEAVSHGEILSQFTTKLKTALNEKKARFILEYDGTQAKNTANVIYGTLNPINFSADMYAPSFVLANDSGAELSLSLGEIRAQYPVKSVMAKFYSADKDGGSLTAEQIKAQKSVCQGFSVYFCDKSGNYVA